MKSNIPVYSEYPSGTPHSIKHIKRGHDHLVVTIPTMHGHRSYGSLTNRYEVDHLSVKCPTKTWMNKGDGYFTHTMGEVIDLINEYRDDYKHITVIGSSAGGYAVLCMAHALKVDYVVAFDPMVMPYKKHRPHLPAIIPFPIPSIQMYGSDRCVAYFSTDKFDQRHKHKYDAHGLVCYDTTADTHGKSAETILKSGRLFEHFPK